ncbi:hypothetical protein IHE45_20G072300 [Dioscorea alata]|uniref:Uncharacterized protein n=1 Tax=Dioscorea alata TaxID=55571 RepID=A0ACB7TSR4_DIOAL|nr:hypothetical protein IHE45_20G072300 [Dioscorea alata]
MRLGRSYLGTRYLGRNHLGRSNLIRSLVKSGNLGQRALAICPGHLHPLKASRPFFDSTSSRAVPRETITTRRPIGPSPITVPTIGPSPFQTIVMQDRLNAIMGATLHHLWSGARLNRSRVIPGKQIRNEFGAKLDHLSRLPRGSSHLIVHRSTPRRPRAGINLLINHGAPLVSNRGQWPLSLLHSWPIISVTSLI